MYNVIAVVRSIFPQNPILSIAATIAVAQFLTSLSILEAHFAAELDGKFPMSTVTNNNKK